jgi:ribonuclease G
MKRRVFVVTRPGERWIALCENDRLIEFDIDRPDEASRVGSILLGRIQRVDKALDAAFVTIDGDRAGFLPLRDAVSRPVEGQPALVQIVRDARGDKGPRLTGRPMLAGRLLGFSPLGSDIHVSSRAGAERSRLSEAIGGIAEPGEGWAVRAAAREAEPAELLEEAGRLREIWGGLLRRSESVKPPAELYREDDPLARMLRDSPGPIASVVCDTRAGADAARKALAGDLPALAAKVAYRPARAWAVDPAGIWEQVEAALEPEVALDSGGSLLIEPGRTLTAIDVDSGEFSGRRTQLRSEHALLEINLEAAAEIARQVRLRNLGGLIVVDFIDMAQASARNRVVKALRDALQRDPMPCRIGSISRFGLLEMARRRRGRSLAEMLTVVCPQCGGAGRLPKSGSGPISSDG